MHKKNAALTTTKHLFSFWTNGATKKKAKGQKVKFLQG